MFIELDGWQAKLRFSACHFIPGHPKCGRLHGHTYAVSVRIEGEKSGEFIVDFEKVKDAVLDICEGLDHRVIIAANDTRLRIVRRDGSVEILTGKKRYVLPEEDIAFLPVESVSAEDLCTYFAGRLMDAIAADNIRCIRVRVDEGIGQGAGCSLPTAGEQA